MHKVSGHALVATLAALAGAACHEAAGTVEAADSPDEMRIAMVENVNGTDYRFRVDLAPGTYGISYGVRGSGDVGSQFGFYTTTLSAPFEIAYRERQITGADVLTTVETLSDEATSQAILDAAPGFADTSLHRFELRVGDSSLEGIAPRSVTTTSAVMFHLNHIGEPDGTPTTTPLGEEFVLAQRIAIAVSSFETYGGYLRDGVHMITIAGETSEVREVLQKGEHPGWSVWIKVDRMN